MKGTVVVMYPRSYLWIGIGGMIFYGGVLLLMALSRAMGNETATWPVFVVFGGLCSLSVLLVVGYIRDRHYLTRDGIHYSRFLGWGRGHMRWRDVKRVSYSRFWRLIILEDRFGNKARISEALDGVPVLLGYIRRYVPETAISPSLRRTLNI